METGLLDGYEEFDFTSERRPDAAVSFDFVKKSTPGFTTVLPLVSSKMPQKKAVVLVRLNNLKTNYGIRITWTGVQWT